MYDLAIIGGGPAGVAASVYAARKQLKTVFIAKEWGGQSIVSEEIQNWIGTEKISGMDLAKDLKGHAYAYADAVVDIKDGMYVKHISKISGEEDAGFSIETDKETFQAKTVLIGTGSSRRKLTVPGADTYENKGITYCASCDGPLFGGQDVAVIGGGNAAFETCAQLLAYCKSVTLLNRSEEFRADEITVAKVKADPKMTIVTGAELTSVTGDRFVTGLTYKNRKSGEEKSLAVAGVFVEIGALPATDFAKDVVELNQYGAIVVDPRNQQTSTPGIWAAGDCTDGLYHQNNIAAGDAVKALEDIYLYIKTR